METNILNTLGAGSGLDSKAIVDALVNAERAPQESRISDNISASEAEISGLGVLKSALGTLKDSFTSLNKASEFTKNAFVNAQTSSFLVEAQDSPIEGKYSITVDQLASSQIQRLFYGFGGGDDNPIIGFTSLDMSLNLGETMEATISVGGVDHNLSISDPTPAKLIDEINAANLGINARAIDAGDGSGYQILLTGLEGSDNAFSLSLDGIGSEKIRDADNAELTVDGISISRSSNKIGDAIPGVDIELFSTQAQPVSVNVLRDIEPVKELIRDFVSAVNAFNDVVRALGDRESTDEDGTGSLAGNGTLKILQSQIRRKMGEPELESSGTIRVLGEIGLNYDLAGVLQLDEAKLAKALDESFDATVEFFTGELDSVSGSDGFAGKFVSYLDTQLASEGAISSQTELVRERKTRYESQLSVLEERMEQLRERYMVQFTAMEQAVQQFNSLRDSLKSQFDNMPFTSKNN